MNFNPTTLSEKIQTLSPEQIREVETFVEFLRLQGQEQALTRTSALVSGPAFAEIWDNLEDDAYDAL